MRPEPCSGHTPYRLSLWLHGRCSKPALNLEKGEFERAEQQLGSPTGEESCILKSRLLLKKGELENARGLLQQLEQDVAAGQRYGSLIQVLLLQTSVFHALGEQSTALETLVRCLTLAHPQAYLMTFLEEGDPVFELLQVLQSRPLPQPLAEYVLRLLQAFEQRKERLLTQHGVGSQGLPAAEGKASPAGDLPEALTPRELDVLQLLAQGCSNQQIAAQLVLSTGTVKFYMHAIMGKLGVHSRTQAILIARERNLV